MKFEIIEYTKDCLKEHTFTGCTGNIINRFINDIFEEAECEKTLIIVKDSNGKTTAHTNVDVETNTVTYGTIYSTVLTKSQAKNPEFIQSLVRDIVDNEGSIQLDIEKVVFKNPLTTVYWKDGTTTTVKTVKGDVFDQEKGLAMAIAKKAFGNSYDYWNVFKTYCTNHEPEPEEGARA